MSEEKNMLCPKDNQHMALVLSVKKIWFRDTLIEYSAERYQCPVCGTETATLQQAAQIQKSISDSYREKKGHLSE